MKKIFLGGTCNNSKWRDLLIADLNPNKVTYFNPVVEHWTEECQAEEIKQRETCDVCLYVITPKMTGSFAIAEIADDSNKRPEKTVFFFTVLDEFDTFTPHQVKSLNQVGKLVESNGATWCKTWSDLVDHLNG